ncbi:MAG: aldehyde dehydrogenase family protein [Gemmatimonadetes bacterium]|nr:aldehyde dehydrogenase family protein [Gemmatimonadota bacterium]
MPITDTAASRREDVESGDTIAPRIAASITAARAAQSTWQALGANARGRIIERFRQALYRRRDEVATLISRENGKAGVRSHDDRSGDVARLRPILRPHRPRPPGAASPHVRDAGPLAQADHDRARAARSGGRDLAVELPVHAPGGRGASRAARMERGPAQAIGTHTLVRGAAGGAAAGSVATGRKVGHACAERFIPCALELGGSDPAIVCDDADVEHAASGITWGRFSNGGQTCVAPKRVYVAATVYDRFVAAMQQRVQSLQLKGAGTASFDVGPLIQPSQATTLAAQGDDATARGARAWRAAGTHPEGVFPPTLLLDVPPAARALCEETFGPLLPIVRVRDDAEAIALANATPFGLSASVWSRNRARARAIAAQLQAGTVVINDVTLVAGIAEVPHGGMKASGAGRAHGAMGLEECVRTRTVVDDLFTSWRQAWWFGYGADSAARGDAYVRLAHGPSILARLSGVSKTLQLLFRPERPI